MQEMDMTQGLGKDAIGIKLTLINVEVVRLNQQSLVPN